MHSKSFFFQTLHQPKRAPCKVSVFVNYKTTTNISRCKYMLQSMDGIWDLLKSAWKLDREWSIPASWADISYYCAFRIDNKRFLHFNQKTLILTSYVAIFLHQNQWADVPGVDSSRSSWISSIPQKAIETVVSFFALRPVPEVVDGMQGHIKKETCNL